jgi:hypothetical protein
MNVERRLIYNNYYYFFFFQQKNLFFCRLLPLLHSLATRNYYWLIYCLFSWLFVYTWLVSHNLFMKTQKTFKHIYVWSKREEMSNNGRLVTVLLLYFIRAMSFATPLTPNHTFIHSYLRHKKLIFICIFEERGNDNYYLCSRALLCMPLIEKISVTKWVKKSCDDDDDAGCWRNFMSQSIRHFHKIVETKPCQDHHCQMRCLKAFFPSSSIH